MVVIQSSKKRLTRISFVPQTDKEVAWLMSAAT
jgi:hypothetical protein